MRVISFYKIFQIDIIFQISKFKLDNFLNFFLVCLKLILHYSKLYYEWLKSWKRFSNFPNNFTNIPISQNKINQNGNSGHPNINLSSWKGSKIITVLFRYIVYHDFYQKLQKIRFTWEEHMLYNKKVFRKSFMSRSY